MLSYFGYDGGFFVFFLLYASALTIGIKLLPDVDLENLVLGLDGDLYLQICITVLVFVTSLNIASVICNTNSVLFKLKIRRLLF